MSQALPPTEFEPCEKVLIPQKLYYRRGAFQTIATEISTIKCAIFANNDDLEIMKLVEKELNKIAGIVRVYPMFLDDSNHTTAQMTINSIIPSVDTVVAVGSSKLFNEIAQVLHKTPKQLVVLPTDGKPLALMTGTFVSEAGAIVHDEKLIPEFVILDSGLTHRITKQDTFMLAEVASVEEETVMGTWTKTAQTLSAALLEGYGKIDMPVWKERATNLVGITMLGKPDGNRVVKILGLI
ncbi:GTA-2-like_protein [Hexamita inflata]|uniref:GTA-2-like protein n=1 Tax=Hexamita inflata TaxID=28002 RepID=A0AA86P1C8_9EUKA|nr:GTA-2-like protein [Hexamita inflata]CAI9962991.1 GTA-2-like protein [Hexamita inflata]